MMEVGMSAGVMTALMTGLILVGPATQLAVEDLGPPLKVYPVESGIERQQLDPSGLYLDGGRLLAVSDKVDATIFEIVRGETTAVMKPFLTLNPDDLAGLRKAGTLSAGNLDLEGITGDGRAFYVVSERDRRVLRVSREGRVEPYGPHWRALHERFKWTLFSPTDGNASFEGVCVRGGRLYVANERSQAAILHVNAVGPPVLAHGVLGGTSLGKGTAPETATPAPVSEPLRGVVWRLFPGAHLSDLCLYRDRLYALDRLGRQIIEVDAETLAPGRRYFYGRTEALPVYQYVGFGAFTGLAEGLAIDDQRVYVLLDNNGLARRSAPDDKRPLLFEFATPASMRESGESLPGVR